MAGYNWSAGMSNNAVDAYYDGFLPKTKFCKYYKISPAKFDKLLQMHNLSDEDMLESEWHHTSKYFNQTYMYRPTEYGLYILSTEFKSQPASEELDFIISKFWENKENNKKVFFAFEYKECMGSDWSDRLFWKEEIAKMVKRRDNPNSPYSLKFKRNKNLIEELFKRLEIPLYE